MLLFFFFLERYLSNFNIKNGPEKITFINKIFLQCKKEISKKDIDCIIDFKI